MIIKILFQNLQKILNYNVNEEMGLSYSKNETFNLYLLNALPSIDELIPSLYIA